MLLTSEISSSNTKQKPKGILKTTNVRKQNAHCWRDSLVTEFLGTNPSYIFSSHEPGNKAIRVIPIQSSERLQWTPFHASAGCRVNVVLLQQIPHTDLIRIQQNIPGYWDTANKVSFSNSNWSHCVQWAIKVFCAHMVCHTSIMHNCAIFKFKKVDVLRNFNTITSDVVSLYM